MKNYTKALILFVSLLYINFSFGQLIYELPFNEQVNSSNLIVEGKVINSKSYWTSDYSKIYTAHTIKVFKVFKGEAVSEITLITPGGTIGLEAQIVRPSLDLRNNDVGVFMLKPNNLELIGSNANTYFQTSAPAQSFYKYDFYDNVVANPFIKTEGIADNFYQKIQSITKQVYLDNKGLDVPIEVQSLKNLNRSTAAITSFTPTTSTAGTKSQITISGSAFGDQQGNGTLFFSDADAGGNGIYKEVYADQIISWSNTQIVALIPSFAGTGKIKVRTNGGDSYISSQVLTITYAFINVPQDITDPPDEYQTQLINEVSDGSDNSPGGYTFRFNTNFANNSAAAAIFETALENWTCRTGVNWVRGSNTSTSGINHNESLNNINTIFFGPSDNGTLGTASTGYSGCYLPGTTTIVWYATDIDVIFNQDINWYFGDGTPGSGQYDFQSVATHELGHAHQLGHIIDPGAMMHYSLAATATNRTFEQNDVAAGLAMMSRSAISVCGQGVMTTLEIDGCNLGIEDLALEGISIYPNPVSDRLIIKNKSNRILEKAEIYDIQGRFVSSHLLKNNGFTNSISAHQLSKGMYFLRLYSDSGNSNIKFVVSN